MNILIEGPDGCGKSTFIKALQKEFKNHTIWHLTKTTPDVTEGPSFYRDKKNCIFDRGILSTYVYSKIFKDTKIPSQRDIKSILNKMDAVVFCLPFSKPLYLRHFQNLKNTREEEYSNMSDVFDEFTELYLKWFPELKNRWKLDIFERPEETTKYIIKNLKILSS